ncbi:2-dehydro-3-deoxygalactonokinase [Aureimonas fodinaquatilis]|uniref:2-dehydro-3-deoxygalactonokinase n=1 Tax=Aureimonas fodinaquatilis TaxID=2565783 RepID=UPI003CCC6448
MTTTDKNHSAAKADAPFCVAVDWGTSSFRLWLLATDGTVLAERRSDEGLILAAREGFANILDQHLARLQVPDTVPVVMCGMVGARGGWLEAAYLPAPLVLEDLALHASPVAGQKRRIHILPGVCQHGEQGFDVMRGEETKLLGAGLRDGLVLMPGTHTKWAQVANGSLSGFSTFMTGELFAHLSHGAASVLRPALEGAGAVAPHSEAFAQAVVESLNAPEQLSNKLFGVRAGWLLEQRPAEDNMARLSGLLIGMEIAGALSIYQRPGTLCLIGAGPGAAAYRQALDVAGFKHITVLDADDCVQRGLMRAALRIHGVEGVGK